MSDYFPLLGPAVSMCIFVGGAFFWLLRRQEAKRLEDKATFVDLYQKLNKLTEDVAYLRGKDAAEG